MNVTAIKTRIFRLAENLADFILEHIPKISNGSIIVVTSKIGALSEGRIVRVLDNEEKLKWIIKESEQYIETKWCYLTLKDGQWCANAGIDESNVDGGGIILLPKNSYSLASNLRRQLMKMYKVKDLGVLITDSRVLPLRAGVTGVALGYAGFKGLRNYVDTKDIFGRKLKMTQTNVADSLATAAVLEMGEGSERCPLALITKARVQFHERPVQNELRIDPKDDLYRPLFQNLKSNNHKPPGRAR
jgi:dihydrofolate synthase / folylpolyglutamate synthase